METNCITQKTTQRRTSLKSRVKSPIKYSSKVYGLSQRENQICKAIYSLDSIEVISEAQSLSVMDTRKYIRRVCIKLGYKSPVKFVKDLISCNIKII